MNKIKKSIELFKEAKLHMPGGVNSPVRAFKNINGNPIFFKKAKFCFFPGLNLKTKLLISMLQLIFETYNLRAKLSGSSNIMSEE